MCWNQQQCSETVIVYHGQTKRLPGNGCENSTNQAYQLSPAGQLTTLMTSLKGHCIVPQPLDPENASSAVRLVAGECKEGVVWSHDPQTHELKCVGCGAEPLCVAVHEKGGGGSGPPAPPQAPEIWAKPLPKRGAAVALLNRGAEVAPMAVALADIPWLRGMSGCDVEDIWAGTNSSGVAQVHYDVRSHQVSLAAFLRLLSAPCVDHL